MRRLHLPKPERDVSKSYTAIELFEEGPLFERVEGQSQLKTFARWRAN